MSQNVRVRFAPSPTGLLHIGGLRTALYNYLFARKNGGSFVLRIEDTDQNRYVEGAEDDIIASLQWAGIQVDEGPGFGGNFGPYRQSERSALYAEHAKKLIEVDKAYYAFDTSEELEAMREKLQTPENPNPKYDATTRVQMRNSLTMPKEQVAELIDSKVPYVIRLKTELSDQIIFNDLIRGNVRFDAAGLDDQILIKSDGLPTYHLANVVDDHLMQITHVIRGEEWLPSAPKHLLLYRYFGWEPPVMAHLPLLMSPSGGKLSKRKAEQEGIPVNVRDYVSGAYEPEAVLNFLAFLGWSPGDEREIFSIDDMISEFSLNRVSKSGAIFNYKKLIWYNEQYVRAQTPEQLLPKAKPYFPQEASPYGDSYHLEVLRLMIDRISMLSDLAVQSQFFYKAPENFDEKSVQKAWKEDTPNMIRAYLAKIEILEESEWRSESIKKCLEDTVAQFEVGFGKLMLPLRIAITGLGGGPDLFATMQLLGKNESVARMNHALKSLG